MLQNFVADVRYGLRMLRNSPTFTAVAVITLALGVGANTAVFSLVDALWLRPLPIDDAKHLVMVYTTAKTSRGSSPTGPTSHPDLLDYRAGAPAFSGIAGFDSRGSILRVGDESLLLLNDVVTENYFSVLGMKALHGRVFTETEFGSPEPRREVVVSYSFWQKHLGGDPRAVGRTVQLTGSDYAIVGVLPREFRGLRLPVSADIYTPQSVWGREGNSDRGNARFHLFGRLQPGADIRVARSQMDAVAKHLAAAYPKERAGRVVTLQFEPDTREPAVGIVFLAISFLVLLIACANVVTLLLARGETRRREIATRLALGATATRIVGQMLTESLLIALAGAGAAVLVAFAVIRSIPALLPSGFAIFGLDFRLDHRAVAFAFGAASFSLVIFGVAPALLARRVTLVSELKEGAGAGSSRARTIGRNLLVVGQVALSVVLLTGAGLLVRTFINVMQRDVGFDSRAEALILQVLPGQNPSGRAFTETYRELLDAIEAIPGVEAASVGNRMPFSDYGGGRTKVVYAPELQLPNNEPGLAINAGIIDERYLRATGMRLIAGRAFEPRDRMGAPRVVILNEAAARRLFPHGDAVGRHFRFNGASGPDCEVIGIVRDARYNAVTERTMPYLYVAFAQEGSGDTCLFVRTRVGATSILPAVRSAIRKFDATAAVYRVTTLSEHMRAALYVERTAAEFVAVLGLLGLALALVGLYGVLAYYVNRRRQEIGVRMALGAPGRSVFQMVVQRGVLLAAIGTVVGMICSLAVMRYLSDLLVGVSPRDPLTLAAVACLLLLVSALAAAIPARRASKVDPMLALRCE